jgi:two-component system sensor histidine kinase/response regulator
MQAGGSGEVSGRGRVLVVDDEPELRRLVGGVLKGSHEVILAASGEEALELAARERFDAVVLDVTMPGMSGLEVCRALRERSAAYVAILLLTALDDAQSRRAGLEAGADDYVSKPFQRRELELRVQHFVRLAQQDRLIRTQVAALHELVALKDDLSALIVHDLRNPLTGVMTALALLERDASLSPEVRETARNGRFAASRVMDATKDLLQIRLLEANQLPLSVAPASVYEVAARAVDTLRLTAERDGVELRLHVEGDATAPIDEKLVLRAVENLVMNAIRHTRGVVDVEVRRLPTRVVVAVADRGYGVPDELKSGLFDKFGSLELQRAGARRGHGLGLYLVRLVARAHGGDVDVDDREGGGACFRLVLPVPDA